jgi:hypothetical protein
VHIDIGSALAVMEFNAGTKPVDTLMTQLHIPLATSGQDALMKQDQIRLSRSNTKISQQAIKRRKTLKYDKARKSDQNKNREGQVYGPGLLDTLENPNAEVVDPSTDSDSGPARRKALPQKGPQPQKSKKH